MEILGHPASQPIVSPPRATPLDDVKTEHPRKAGHSLTPPDTRITHARSAWFLLLLTLATFMVHGYHPFCEDGGIYAAGVEHALNPTLFPHNVLFVTAYQAYSLFTPIVGVFVRASHLSMPWVFLLIDLACIWTFLFSGLRIARRCFPSEFAARCSVALLAAWFTLPIAGTSLYLMEPYLTARSISTPLSLLAISFALEAKITLRDWLGMAVSLIVAALFQPLMAAHAAGFLIVLLAARTGTLRRRYVNWAALALLALAFCATLQMTAHPESEASVHAIFSRYYWFLSQWQWFELIGIIGPVIVLLAVLRFGSLTTAARQLAQAAIAAVCIATLTSLCFVQEHFHAHPVARLQPLRAYVLIYAVMALLLAGVASFKVSPVASRARQFAVPSAILALACIMFFVQRRTFPASLHLELPGRAVANPWAQAFLWARDHTSPDALFALDARYVNFDGEDAQTFRAVSERDAIPDFSKDGGVAANVAALAASWQQGAAAQQHLSDLPDAVRDARLRPLGATWMVLRANASTQHFCPYVNATVKVCVLD